MIAIAPLLAKKQKEVEARRENTTMLIDADQITVSRDGDTITIRTPYDQKFVKALKYYCRSARWNAAAKTWTVTADDQKDAVWLCRRHFGDLCDTKTAPAAETPRREDKIALVDSKGCWVVLHEDDTITMHTPYSKDFIAAIKTAGGRWNAADKVWTVTADKMDKALAIIADCYHATRLPEGTTVMEALAAHEIRA